MPSESDMAYETEQRLRRMGLRPQYQIYICSKNAGRFPPGMHRHGLPLYCKEAPGCMTDAARQVGRPDLLVVDTITPHRVELIVEFEIDTNPKNIMGNYFSFFPAVEFKPEDSSTVHPLDVMRTVHFLLACLEPRNGTPKQQAAVEKGQMLADWLDHVSVLIAGNVHFCNIFKAHAIAGDVWADIVADFEHRVQRDCPHLFV